MKSQPEIEPPVVAAALLSTRQRLSSISETAALDAQVLLAYVLEKPRTWLLAHPEARLSADQAQALESAARRLQSGEPLPYLLGRWEFYGLEFEVSQAALIPRPETELLVETALNWLRAHPAARWAADVGAGSGCIGVTLAHHIPDLHVLATDVSPAALQLARRNAARHAVLDRLLLVQMDLLSARAPNTAPLDLLCANLPYVPSSVLEHLPVGRWEPHLALDGGPDGLALIRRLLAQAPARLAPGGLALLEIESGQGSAAAQLARQAFPHARIELQTDLAGRDRLLVIHNT